MRNVNKICVPESFSDNESGLRKMKAEVEGNAYVSFKSLADAKSYPESVVILEGDDGGQIYVVCPVSKVKCSEQILQQLLLDLDAKKWDSPDMAHIYYEQKQIGEGVAGGMGGAAVEAEIWIHKEFHDLGLAATIRDVIEGRRAKLN
jgi:hypothetical protein